MNSAIKETREEKTMRILLSLIDKGIDDMEAGRMYDLDEAFRMLEEEGNSAV